MSDKEIGGWFWLLLIFVGGPWAVWHFDLFVLSDEITVYQQMLKCDNNNKNCKWHNYNATTFKVNSNSQTVIFWSSKEPWPLKQAQDCIVVDKKHWNCGKYYKYGFNEGDYTREDTETYRYITKTTWWYNKL